MKQAVERKKAAARIILVVTCVLIAEWIFPPLFGHRSWAFRILIAAILIFGFFTHRALKETPRNLGLRMDNFFRSMLLLGPPMFFSVLLLVLLGYRLGTLGLPASVAWRHIGNYLWLLWWGLLQEYALQAIINRQAQILWGKGPRSVLFVGLIFAALHLPNPALTIATFAGGLIFAYIYQRVPNLFALALSHSVMTMALTWTLPPSLLHSLRVGAAYR